MAACLLQAWASSILPVCSALFLRYSRWFLTVSRSSVQKHLSLFTLPLGMQAVAQLIMMLLITLTILSGWCEKSILSWCRFISNISVKLPQLACLKFQQVLIHGSSKVDPSPSGAPWATFYRLTDLQLWHSDLTNYLELY